MISVACWDLCYLSASSTAASSSCFWVKKIPVSRLFNYGLVRATITRKICFCWQSPETTRDTSVFLLAIGIAKNLECWHNLACSHLKAWIINITLEGKRKKKHALSLRDNRECKPYGLPWNSVFGLRSIPTAKPGGVSFFEVNLPQLIWTLKRKKNQANKNIMGC